MTPQTYCDAQHNWLTQVKLLGTYTLPGTTCRLQRRCRTSRGRQRIAEVDVPGRYAGERAAAYAGVRSRSNVIPPGSWYGERFSQLDLRLTKIFRMTGGTQFRAMFDLFNLFNANAVTREAPGWGGATGTGAGYLVPQVTMAGRLAKFAFQFDF